MRKKHYIPKRSHADQSNKSCTHLSGRYRRGEQNFRLNTAPARLLRNSSIARERERERVSNIFLRPDGGYADCAHSLQH